MSPHMNSPAEEYVLGRSRASLRGLSPPLRHRCRRGWSLLGQGPLQLRQGTEDMELFPVVAARHGAGTARALLGGFLRLPYHCVLALSAYATKIGRSLEAMGQPA